MPQRYTPLHLLLGRGQSSCGRHQRAYDRQVRRRKRLPGCLPVRRLQRRPNLFPQMSRMRYTGYKIGARPTDNLGTTSDVTVKPLKLYPAGWVGGGVERRTGIFVWVCMVQNSSRSHNYQKVLRLGGFLVFSQRNALLFWI